MVFAFGLLWSVYRIGPKGFEEAKNLQGGLGTVLKGKVSPDFSQVNDPRIAEGMVVRGGKIIQNKKLSDDYLQAQFRK